MTDEELRLDAARIAIQYTGADLPSLRALVNGIVAIVRRRPQDGEVAERMVWTDELNSVLKECAARGLGAAATRQHLRATRGLAPSLDAVKAQRTKLEIAGSSKQFPRAVA